MLGDHNIKKKKVSETLIVELYRPRKCISRYEPYLTPPPPPRTQHPNTVKNR